MKRDTDLREYRDVVVVWMLLRTGIGLLLVNRIHRIGERERKEEAQQ